MRGSFDRPASPALLANNCAPEASVAAGNVDALDWYRAWKCFDLLTGCAVFSVGYDRALGGSPEANNVGSWSEGRAVVQPTITDAA